MAAGSAAAPQEVEGLDERLGQGDGGDGRGQETGQRDADLDRRQKLIRVARQPGQDPPGLVLLLETPHLAFPQRDQGHLAAGEAHVEDDQHGHQAKLR